MQKVTPCLWFDGQAEEAVKLYTSIFKNSKINEVSHYGEAGPLPAGTVLTMTFELEGQPLMALNGGPEYKFTPAISFAVDCKTQDEVDELWEKLTEGGKAGQCGWLEDKYGVSWQIIPSGLVELMQAKDPQKAKRVTEAMMQMSKLDIKVLQAAYD